MKTYTDAKKKITYTLVKFTDGQLGIKSHPAGYQVHVTKPARTWKGRDKKKKSEPAKVYKVAIGNGEIACDVKTCDAAKYNPNKDCAHIAAVKATYPKLVKKYSTPRDLMAEVKTNIVKAALDKARELEDAKRTMYDRIFAKLHTIEYKLDCLADQLARHTVYMGLRYGIGGSDPKARASTPHVTNSNDSIFHKPTKKETRALDREMKRMIAANKRNGKVRSE